MKKNLLLVLSVLLSLQLSGCNTIPDKPACMELSPRKAYCTYPIQDKSFYWDDENKYEGKTYWEARPECLRIPPSTYTAYKTFWIKYCKQTNQCTDKDISSWDKKTKELRIKEN